MGCWAVGWTEIVSSQADAARRLCYSQGSPTIEGAAVAEWYSKKNGYCRAENISHEHHKNGGVFFSVMFRNVPDQVILAESSPGEKAKLAYICKT
ncbi:hypothetical protein TNCV_382941 [Trichonephila clavipes]|nr:hypothetical protein TNCV_382941 [Trichonephila clavipes]